MKQNKTVSVVLQRKRWIAASRIQQQSGRGQSVVSYTGLVERYCHPHVHLRSGRDFVGATSVLVDKDRTGNEKDGNGSPSRPCCLDCSSTVDTASPR